MAYETEKIEFKSNILCDIYKEVIVFANTDGGTLHLLGNELENKIIKNRYFF